MELKDAKEWLERYVADDKEYRKNTQDKSDFDKFCDTHIEAIETVLHELEILKRDFDIVDHELFRQEKENLKLMEDIKEYERILDIWDERTYRKRYLEERRKENPKLLYPDADEIYKRYYELKERLEALGEKL